LQHLLAVVEVEDAGIATEDAIIRVADDAAAVLE